MLKVRIIGVQLGFLNSVIAQTSLYFSLGILFLFIFSKWLMFLVCFGRSAAFASSYALLPPTDTDERNKFLNHPIVLALMILCLALLFKFVYTF